MLAVDTATPPSSVAVVRGEEVLARSTGPFGKDADAWVHGAVASLLAEAGLTLANVDRIAAASGPGTFTGIRVALATALGLGAGTGQDVYGVSTLDALAESAQVATGRRGEVDVLALIDARRGQFYGQHARVPASPVLPLQPAWGPDTIDAGEITARFELDRLTVVGTQLDSLGIASVDDLPPLAVSIARLVARSPAEALARPEPNYLRPPDAVPGVSPLRRRPL